MKPVDQTYGELQTAFDVFNSMLFDGALPNCIITLQRKARTTGYFSSERFVSTDDRKKFTHEIAINPEYMAQPVIEVLQTMVHEMCHLWQHCYGQPGRRGYHNKEWGDKMESIGLMPSDTGRPDGKRTGEHMSDYPIEGGKFLEAVANMSDNTPYKISWADRTSGTPLLVSDQAVDEEEETDGTDGKQESVPVKSKNKYSCPCGNSVWGKPGLEIMCMKCDEPFTMV
jgi:hypothetical protein